ncbi:unnamed protein product [Musa hybrid cultivar]
MRAVSGVGRFVARQMRGQRRRRRNHRRPLRPHRRVRGKEIVDHHLDIDGVNHTGMCADQSVALPCFWANNSVSHFGDVSCNDFPSEASLADRYGASNIELRLGQPSQECPIFASSYSTCVMEFGATCNSEKPQLHQELKQQESFEVTLLCGSDLLESFATPGVWILDQVSISLTMILFFC